MSRLTLPQVHAPRTSHLVLFEQEFESLNAFYWVFRSASALMIQQSVSHARVTDFVPQPEAGHLDVSTPELSALLPQTELVARYGILVQVITYYEVYLHGVLSRLLRDRWPGNRQVTLKIRPSDLPSSNVGEYIKSAAIASEVASVIDEGYSKRNSRIKNLLVSSGFPEPAQDPVRNDLVVAACEVRNCIVHSGGRVDQRAHDALGSFFPRLAVGDPLDLDELLLWRLVGAVRDDARAVDYAIRKPASDKAQRRHAKRKRYAANRKAKNLARMTAHKSTP